MRNPRKFCPEKFFVFIFLTLFFLLSNSSCQAEEDSHSLREYLFGIDQEEAKLTFSPKFVKVIRGDETKIYVTGSSDPFSALRENGYLFSNDSKILSYDENHLSNFATIQIIKLQTKIEARTVELPFATKVFDSWQYPLGQEVTEQKGVLGIMVQEVKYYYEDGILIREEILSEEIEQNPVEEIVAIGSSTYTFEGITQRGYDCEYWYSVVDSGNYSPKEKQWLKFVMYCESGCNAESSKSFYKGLFQWSPTLWKKLYTENIFDGEAQIRHTAEKLRSGADPSKMWPACTRKYEAQYGEF